VPPLKDILRKREGRMEKREDKTGGKGCLLHPEKGGKLEHCIVKPNSKIWATSGELLSKG